MNGIGFENMKVIKDDFFFDFAPITIFTGTNNSGKSSVLKGLELLFHNYDIKFKELEKFGFGLITGFTKEINIGTLEQEYGTLEKFVNRESGSNYFSFTVKSTINDKDLNFFKILEPMGNLKITFDVKVEEKNISSGYIDTVSVTTFDKAVLIYQIKEIGTVEKKYISNEEGDYVNAKMNVNLTQYRFNLAYILEFLGKIKQQIENKYLDELHLNSLVNKYNCGETSLEKIEEAISMFPKNNKSYFPKLLDHDRKKLFWYHDDYSFSVSEFNDFLTNCEKYTSFNLDDGIFDFSFLWENNPMVKEQFEKLICNFYKDSFTKSYHLFSNDLLQFISEFDLIAEAKTIFKTEHIDALISKLFFEFEKDPFYPERIPTEYENEIEARFLEKFGLFKKNVLDEIKSINISNKNRNELSERIIKQSIKDQLKLIIDSIHKMEHGFESSREFISSKRSSNSRSQSFYNESELSKQLNISNNGNFNFGYINKWINEFSIAEKFYISIDRDTGHYKAFLEKAGKEYLINDFGLGTNQLLPILLALGNSNYSKIMIIEEPESNLHPALQSKLADLFVDALKSNKNLKIILETHSEYLIRKLQYLTADGVAQPEDSVIYYFYDPNHPAVISGDVEQIKKITIDEAGFLSDDFGSGFFDEAQNIAISLFGLQKSQFN